MGATLRDNRQRIMELTEERSLLSDADECMAARAVLTNPRKRISAEVAWIPGVDLLQTDVVLKQLDPPHQNLLNIIGLTHIARVNTLTAGLSRIANIASINLVEWILAISHAYTRIEPEEVRGTLNEERKLSGFPQITDLSVISTEIQKQRRYYSQTLSTAINSLTVNERARILTLTLETVIGNGNNRCPILIDDLIQSYERDVGDDLEKKQRIIEAQIEKIRAMADAKNPDATLQSIVDQLIQTVKDWDAIAQPIQLSKKSSGERHNASFEIAFQVRELAIHLLNKYEKIDLSKQIINMLLGVYIEVPEIVEHLNEDIIALEEIAKSEEGRKKFEEINKQVEKLKETADAKNPDYTLNPMVTYLIQTVKTWDTSTQIPEANNAVAIVVRNIALHLWNVHQKLHFSKQITNVLIEKFKGVNGMSEVNIKLSEDQIALNGIVVQRINHSPSVGGDLAGCLLNKIITYAVVFGIGGILVLIGSLMEGC